MSHPEGTEAARITQLTQRFHALADLGAVKHWDADKPTERSTTVPGDCLMPHNVRYAARYVRVVIPIFHSGNPPYSWS